jgi:hypothetical protein
MALQKWTVLKSLKLNRTDLEKMAHQKFDPDVIAKGGPLLQITELCEW